MLESNRTDIRRANVRGALWLGGLLAAVLAIAFWISLRLYTQLDAAATVQHDLVLAQQQLDDLVRVQLDQETGLRGFLSTNQTLFLEPYRTGNDEYPRDLAAFGATAQRLGSTQMRAALVEMRALHDQWDRQVARPLLLHPHSKNALTRQTLGKVLIDQMRGDTSRLHTLLEQRLLGAQAELKRRIDEALVSGLVSIVIFGGVCILFVTSRSQLLAVIDRERAIVETLQGAFQTDLDVLPGARIGTAYLSADRDAAVGGDLYDVRRLTGGRGLVLVADVSGKGIGAAVNTAFVKYSMRTLARSQDDPAEILSVFNRMFLETIADPNLFVVAFVGVLDAVRGTLTYASAGHSGAYLRRGGEAEQLSVTGPILGLDPSFGYDKVTVPLARGDLVLLATDGLTEARDGDGTLLDDEGAMALLRGASRDPQACADELVAAVRRRSGGILRDDLALLVIAIDGGA
jgi:sigma-B regulation protein RsbU (phosphoserine phosphatase)